MLLEVRNVFIHYEAAEAVRDVSLAVEEGSVVGIIGANGAGKSTILKALSGMLPLTRGEIFFKNERIDGLPAHEIVRRGIVHVPEARRLFPHMSVLANLKLGAYLRDDKAAIEVGPRSGLQALSQTERAAQSEIGHPKRRRAGDACHLAGADVEPEAASAR